MPLKIDYVDSMFLGNRKYIQTKNPDGSVSFTDATDYEQVGDTFGSADINATNTLVNEIVDGTTKVKIALESESCSGNADTATKLKTPRTINGVNFDGTAPITITANPNSHNQTASTITAGTLGGQVLANASSAANVGTAQVRNIYAGTGDMVAGSTVLATGTLYFMYE